MFDVETERFIRSAASLDGLDLEELPRRLTEAYAVVMAARLGSTSPLEKDPNWVRTRSHLRRLASTYEALALFLPFDDERRSACAFVAASAHHLLARAARVQAGGPIQQDWLTEQSVAPEVSATLLFMIGEHQADALEAARLFSRDLGGSTVDRILQAIAALASGDGARLRSVVSSSAPRLPVEESDDYQEQAIEHLWQVLLGETLALSRFLLGDIPSASQQRLEWVVATIENATTEAARLPTRPIHYRFPAAGPYHLARLLLGLCRSVAQSAIVTVPPPSGVDPARWRAFLRSTAARRPLLWRNHWQAIQAGFLEKSLVVTFPTGAGKSTLCELRIAAELLRRKKTFYLVPTRALVDQVSNDLRRSLRAIDARAVTAGDPLGDDDVSVDRVYVQTPEQCLAFLSRAELDSDVGVIIFDECHSLSGTDEGGSRIPTRRSVDAMFALLQAIEKAPDAAVILLSALVANPHDLSKWIAKATGRECSILDLAWKPTRQVKGIVAYPLATVDGLKEVLEEHRAQRKTKAPGVALRRVLHARPVGLFCYSQRWDASSRYAAVPLLRGEALLGVNKYWRLTANRNEIAGRIAGLLATVKVRTIVFTQQIGWCYAIAEKALEVLRPESTACNLTRREQRLFEAAALELGTPDAVQIPIEGRVAIHHGQLLPSERLLTESAFSREGGPNLLVATPTVAQGMNLPAEAVVIAGDDRWESSDVGTAGGMETIPAHELLNAAGRAGRAGHFAHGLVVDVPGQVFSFERNGPAITSDALEHATEVFGQADQCLKVTDPITQILDRIALATGEDDVGAYLVRRLPRDPAELRSFFSRTLAGALSKDPAFAQRAADTVGASVVEREPPIDDELSRIAMGWGVGRAVVERLANSSMLDGLYEARTFAEFLMVPIDVLIGERAILDVIGGGTSGLDEILGRERASSRDAWEGVCATAIQTAVPLWISGADLTAIDGALSAITLRQRSLPLEYGRRFALRAASGIAHGASLVVELLRRKTAVRELPRPHSRWLDFVAVALREGFDDPDKLFLYWVLRRMPGLYPRVAVHRAFTEIGADLGAWTDETDPAERRRNIRKLARDALL